MLDFSNWFLIWDNTCMVNGTATIACLPFVFVNLIRALILFMGLTTLIIFIFGGYKFMNAAGDPKKLESSKHNFEYGLLGLAVIAFSFLILKIIASVTGVSCITGGFFGCILPTP